jgi:VRR-NUC domain
MKAGQPKKESGFAKPHVLEAEFQSTVIEMAQACGWECFYIPDSKRAAQVGRPKGWPDLTLVHPVMHVLIFVECKVDAAYSKLSPEQTKWLMDLENCGELVQLWRPSIWPHIERVLQGPIERTWDALENAEGIGKIE